jgi:hypothetical protein
VTESESRSAVVEEGLEVSKMRMRAVKICCAVGLGGAVQGPALKPRVEVRGGMA